VGNPPGKLAGRGFRPLFACAPALGTDQTAVPRTSPRLSKDDIARAWSRFPDAGWPAASGARLRASRRVKRLRPTPLEVKEGYVTSVAFGPEGKTAAA
ncbi:MAG: hypothetical protein WBX00_27560, partial [Isosphaeraceae bacterium]